MTPDEVQVAIKESADDLGAGRLGCQLWFRAYQPRGCFDSCCGEAAAKLNMVVPDSKYRLRRQMGRRYQEH